MLFGVIGHLQWHLRLLPAHGVSQVSRSLSFSLVSVCFPGPSTSEEPHTPPGHAVVLIHRSNNSSKVATRCPSTPKPQRPILGVDLRYHCNPNN